MLLHGHHLIAPAPLQLPLPFRADPRLFPCPSASVPRVPLGVQHLLYPTIVPSLFTSSSRRRRLLPSPHQTTRHKIMTHSVLLLGSGFVAKPCLDVLAEAGIHTTVGKYPELGMFGWDGVEEEVISVIHWLINFHSLPYSRERKEALSRRPQCHSHLS